MLHGGNDSSNILEILQQFAESDQTFYLTGSRFFGTERAKSDWDFFVQNSETIRTQLSSWGFIPPVENEEYQDTPLQEVVQVWHYPINQYAKLAWESRSANRFWRKQNTLVDVQISLNAIKKYKIQEILFDICKKQQQVPTPLMWELAFKLYREE